MEYNVNTHENWHTVVSVTVPAKDAAPKYDETFAVYKKGLKVDGFRAGKVPTGYIKKAYGKQIEMDAFQDFIQEAWKKVFDENEFHVIDDPKIENLTYANGKDLTFEIVFDVRPEFTVDAYDGMPVEKTVYVVKDEDIENYINELRERNAMMYTLEDAEAAVGHYLTADFQELDADGIPVIGVKFENQNVYLGEEDNELTPQLVGAKVGDERKVELTIKNPQEGNEAAEEQKFYMCSINQIQERRLPELDDDFAKDMGEYETFQDMQEKVRADLEKAAENRTKYEFENNLSDTLIEKTELQLPPSMLERYTDSIMESVKARNKDNKQKAADMDQLREYYKVTAERDLKWHLISDEIIENEEIKVTDDEVDTALKELEATEEGKKQIESLNADEKAMNRYKDNLVFDKLFTFLAEKAEITEVEKGVNEPEAPVEEAEEPADAE